MKAVPGIDLASEVKVAENELMQDQQRKVRSMVSGVLTEISKYSQEKIEAEKNLKKAEEKLSAAIAKRSKLLDGDWSILNENMHKSQPTSEK